MSDHKIILPSKPRIVREEETKGVYEIDGLYPGYGHTLGNSLRRIILSSLPGAAITLVRIDGVSHEFSTMDGIKEDVITILLNLKRTRFKVSSDEPQIVSISAKGPGTVTAKDIKVGGQVEVLNPDQYICEITTKTSLNIEMTIESGLGFVPKDVHQKSKVDVGTIALDAIFSPIRRVQYEVEDMRVGDKTNHNRLRVIIETDGTLSPREALERSIITIIEQLQAIVDFKPEAVKAPVIAEDESSSDESKEDMSDVMKTRIDSLDLSTRTMNALQAANIRTIGGIARKRVEDLLEIDGIGDKGITEIKDVLKAFSISLKD